MPVEPIDPPDDMPLPMLPAEPLGDMPPIDPDEVLPDDEVPPIVPVDPLEPVELPADFPRRELERRLVVPVDVELPAVDWPPIVPLIVPSVDVPPIVPVPIDPVVDWPLIVLPPIDPPPIVPVPVLPEPVAVCAPASAGIHRAAAAIVTRIRMFSLL